MVVRSGVALAVALLLAFIPSVSSNHPQIAHGDVIVFDYRTGNEWWIEVLLSGGASGSVQSVASMDTGGPWVAMTSHPDYAPGDWAASYHIEPGHQVKFRASWAGGEMVESCWFTNPGGVEQCGSSSSSTSVSTTTTSSSTTTTSSTSTSTSPPGGCFAATFTIKSPNEWWQELYPSAGGHTVNAAQVRVNGGPWQSMSHSSWGAWTSSVHTVAGSNVEFRVTDTMGGSSTSLPFTWLDGSMSKGSVSCGTTSSSSSSTTTTSSSSSSTTPPPPPGFKATFTGVQGNEWWVQSNVAVTGGTLSKVDARWLNGGTGGQWTASWSPLTKQSWGGWAASYHLPAGTLVQLRALSTAGAESRSASCYRWTAASAEACPALWPEEGTTLHYQFSHIESGSPHPYAFFEESWSNMTATFHNGDWVGSCTERRLNGPSSDNVTETIITNNHSQISLVDPYAPVGGAVRAFVPHGCEDVLAVDAQREADWFRAVPMPDGVATVRIRDYVQGPDNSPTTMYRTDLQADRAQALLLSWDVLRTEYSCECGWQHDIGKITLTNVPIGPVVDRAQQKSDEGTWPASGSHIGIGANSLKPDGWRNQTYLRIDYDAAAHHWTGTCEINTYSPGAGVPGGPSPTFSTEQVTLSAFPSGPGNAQVGGTVQLQLPRRCIVTPVDAVVGAPSVAQVFGPPGGGNDGAEPHAIEVQSGQGTGSPPQGTAHWDPETGLLMDWDWTLPDGAHLYGAVFNEDLDLQLR